MNLLGQFIHLNCTYTLRVIDEILHSTRERQRAIKTRLKRRHTTNILLLFHTTMGSGAPNRVMVNFASKYDRFRYSNA